MKTITLKDPWSYAHVHLGKRVENRTWRIPKDRYALHTGKSYDVEGEQYIRSLNLQIDFRQLTPSVIFAVCDIIRVVEIDSMKRATAPQQERLFEEAVDQLEVLDAPAALVDIPADQRCWAFGPYAHLYDLKTFRILPRPVPCGGAQGLWDLPLPVWSAVLEQLLEMPPVVLNRHVHGKPQGSVYVGRPTKWGNPFVWDAKLARVSDVEVVPKDEVLPRFEEWVGHPRQARLVAESRVELRGRDLVCSCAPKPCHADTWLRVANQGG